MATEIERKFLVTGDAWREGAPGTEFMQGYLSRDPARSVRVRLAGDSAWLTIKGPSTGLSRPEFEYPIPPADARALLELCPEPPIEKTRFRIDHHGHQWEIDEFHGANAGLILAEIELESEDASFARPAWAGREVSRDPRYFNASLVHSPFRDWPENEPQTP